jgi:aryl-alcohol dehydrogenase-like predicted oxidoreductase
MSESRACASPRSGSAATISAGKLLDVAMSRIASRPLVASVIAGATKPEQVEANVKGATLALTPEDLAALDKLTG